MNIYLVSRTDEVVCDEYHSAVIIAATDKQARELWPGPVEWRHYDTYAHRFFDNYFMDLGSLKVEHIGMSLSEEARVVHVRIVVC